MPTERTVADDVLGKLGRRFWDMFGRVIKGVIDPERALHFVQLGLENVPDPIGVRPATYIIESRWSYDNSHREFATISFEQCDVVIPFENLLDPATPKDAKTDALKRLRRIYYEQVPGHGSRKLVRLYRLAVTNFFGYLSFSGLDGTLLRDMVDLHFALKPICDFDDDGQPIACEIKPRTS